MSEQKLRPYQVEALERIRALYAKNEKKVLLHMATGSGKTTVFCAVFKSVHERGKKALLVVRGKDLVDQASKRLTAEGVPHGVLQANHWLRRPSERIQLCSIDTLYRRKLKPPADLIVIDEAHHSRSPSYMWLVEQYPDAFYLPVTATPHVKDGLRHVADQVVYPITMKELIEQGFLVPPVYYIPSKPDLSRVDIDSKTHDYKTDQLGLVMNDPVIFGDIARNYKLHASGRKALLFAVNVAHSLAMVEALNAEGIRTAHVDAKTPNDLRLATFDRLAMGELDVVSNVGVLTTGVDLPFVSAIIMARPTKSYNLFVQILGRATRTAPGKKDFIVLDHARNVLEHGLIQDERLCKLDGYRKSEMPDDVEKIRIVTCRACYYTWDPKEQYADDHNGEHGYDWICRGIIRGELCGTDNTPSRLPKERESKTEADQSFEMKRVESVEEFEDLRIKNFIDQKADIAVMRAYKQRWVYHQVKERYGEAEADKRWPYIKKSIIQAATRSFSASHY